MTNKMSKSIGIILTIMSVFTTCRSLPDLHKQMTPQQLQTVFHVDSIHAVPHYEVINLLHHNAGHDGIASPETEHYRRRRRSIDVNKTAGEATTQKDKYTHHVKKDLSKSPYYSELKHEPAYAANNANSLNSAKQQQHKIDLSQIKAHNVSFNAFGEDVNLTLKPTKGLFKGSPHTLRMWAASNEANATNGLDLEELIDEDHRSNENIGEVFQDEANMAAILMRRHLETGDLIMEGSIGHDMVIKPLPHELSPNKHQAHHVIYKREAASMEHLSDFAFMEPDDIAASEKLERLQSRQKRSATTKYDEDVEFMEADALPDNENNEEQMSSTHARRKRQAPYIIYPEVLVIVDYDGYRLHGGDNLQVKRYFISFWNGVDLRYRLLKGPRIRISIAGIIISRGRDATPYLERNRVGRDAIDSAAALTDMGKYLFRERRLPVYDIAVAITKLDMCRRATAYGECNRGTAGFAYVGGACVVNKRLEKVNSVAIIEDTGGFSGIIVAAHEVGHLLGAVHDGSPPPSYLGGPGAQRCRWEDGYIMSDLRHTERGFRWSPCTVQSFHHFLNGDTASCLHNAPHEDGALGRSLPGTLLSLDAQCRRDRGTYACFKDERVCAQLFCFDAQTGYCVAYRPAAEGSSCGNEMHCLDGRCSPLPTNVIPDYGKQYRLAYKNADDADDHNNDEAAEGEENDNDDDDDEDNDNDNNEDEQPQTGANKDELNNYNNEDDDEAYLQQNFNKNDNSVEQTKIADERTSTISNKMSAVTSTSSPTTTTTITPYTTKTETQHKETNTFEYLTRFFENNNKQWQQFFNIPPPPPPPPRPTTTLRSPQANGNVVVKSNKSFSGNSKSSNEATYNEIETKHKLNNTTEHKQEHQQIQTKIYQQQQQQQQQQQTQPQENLLNFYTNEFRKQFQYYINLLSNTKNSSSKSNKTTMRTNSLNSNCSVTKQNGQQLDNSNAADIDDNEDVDSNDESDNNEAFAKQKRKFNVVQQQHQQQAQQHIKTTTQDQLKYNELPSPTPTSPISSTSTTTTTSKATTTLPTRTSSSSYVFGGRSTPRSSQPGQFEAYFKKLQALSAATPTNMPITSTTTTTKDKSSTSTTPLKQQQQQQQQQQNIYGNFFKRTHITSSTNNEKQNNKYKSSKNSSNISFSNTRSSSLNSKQPVQQQPQQQQHYDESTTTQQPNLVTNYIGDNTNNLPKVLINVAEQQQQQTTQKEIREEQQYISYTTSTITSSNSSTTTVTQKPKLKTQKLIRRQLRRISPVK